MFWNNLVHELYLFAICFPSYGVNLDEFCKEIISLDPKIRFVGLYYQSELTCLLRDGLESILTIDETMSSLRSAVIRWGSRKSLKHKLGMPHFEISRYDEVYLITLSIGENDLMLVSTDIDCDILEIESKLEIIQKKIIQEFNDG